MRRTEPARGARPAGRWLRRLAATPAVALASAACWFAWMGWDQHKDVDATGHETGPYEAWQVVGCVLCLVVVAVVALRWLPAPAVIVTMAFAFTVAWSVSATSAPSPDGSFWVIGAGLVFVGVVVGTAVVAALASSRRPSR